MLLQIIFSFQDILRTLLANGTLASFVGLTPRYTVDSTPFTVFTVDMKITTAIKVTDFLICMTTRNPYEIRVEFIRQRCTLRYLQILQIVRSLYPAANNSILGLCKGVFTDRFIFRHILGHLFTRKWNPRHVYERVRRILRYQKGKRNVIKRQKLSFLGLQVLSTALWDLKDILNSQQNRSQNKLVHKNAVSRVHGVLMDQFILFSRFRLWAAEMLNSTHYRNTVETDNMTFFSP